MPEYIEKEKALNLNFTVPAFGTKLTVARRAVQSYVDALAKIPSADVQPARHGRWGKDNDCSECGCQAWFERDIHTLNYCPNCGCKMDGGEK